MPPTQLSAVHPSPKRKRDHAPHVPLLNTALRAASTPTPTGSPVRSGADSPRNAVADQLEGLNIASLPAIPMPPLTPSDDIVRKKPKLEAMRVDSKTSLSDFTDAELVSWEKQMLPDAAVVRSAEPSTAREIPETPQSQNEVQRRQPRTFVDFAATTQPVEFRSPSPMPPVFTDASASRPGSKLEGGTRQPRSRDMKSPSPPLSSLTWKDSEITGHLADPSMDPDDDGTGINGIGFKPTPALAYQRAQKRKQQVMDWRARENREARAKRNQRRHRGIGGAGTSSREASRTRETSVTRKEAEEATANRRIVRFAT